MIDERTNKKMTEKQILKAGLDHIAEACCFFYELESDAGKGIAVMCDTVIRCAEALYKGKDPRHSEI